MAELCLNCFQLKGQSRICPNCGFAEGADPAQPYYLSPGTVLGKHFIVGTVIGVGNYGITYRCYDSTLGVVVAVKEFFPMGFVSRAAGEKRVWLLTQNQGHQYRDKVQRFLMEARSIARFGKAKDIVNVYDFFEENNTAYIIMEYVDDPLLQDYLEQCGRLDAETACKITESIIEAVKKLHAIGIIHRDVSPDNIFIAADYSIKLFDFGSAHIEDSQTIEEKVIKPGYTAPEQYADVEENQGFYTDIYSIGAILYHMLTGVPPQDGRERYHQDTLRSPLETGIRIDSSLDRVVMEAMAVRTELRIQNMNQLSDALHGRRRAEYPQEKIERQRRTRGWIAMVSVLLVIAIGVGGTLVYNAVHGAKNIMFDTKVTADTLTVWVDSQGMLGTLREVVSEMQEISESDSKVIRRMKEENKNVQYNIINIAKDGKTMEQALQEAKGKDTFPDVFVTDRVSDLKSYALLSYQDNVAASVEGQTHIYLSQYAEKYQSQTEMPTSFDVLLLYAIGTTDTRSVWHQRGSNKAGLLVSDPAEMKEGRILTSSLLDQQEQNGTIALQKILEANEQGREYTYLGSETVVDSQANEKGKTLCLEQTQQGWQTAAEMAILAESSGFDLQSGKFQFGDKYVQKMGQYAGISEISKEKCQWKLTDAKESGDYLYGNSILAGSGYRSVLAEAKRRNSNVPYEVYVPTVDDRMLTMHTGKLAISAESSTNKQVAGMRLVYFALEQQHSNSNQDTTYPLSVTETEQEDSFTSFFGVNPSQQVVHDLVRQWSFPCVLIGRGSGNIYHFATGLQGMDAQAAKEETALQAYCEEYERAQN
ncbi:MAG: serine/threonine protein kinase [Lachnospiraceae bacterium]|nr:serine/threonine protein kinase [Lachnospiraceae bacterium]